jgi:hypothetical protein
LGNLQLAAKWRRTAMILRHLGKLGSKLPP